MKKQDDIHITFRTIIKDISPIGSELSNEQLRLVAGGLKPKQAYRGMTGCTPPDDANRRAKPDYEYDA